MYCPCPEFQYHQRTGKFDFWFTPGCPVIEEAVQVTIHGKPEQNDILKQDEKRLLFIGKAQNHPRFVVKINLLPRCKDRFRARLFAPQECQCHMRIAKTGIPVPELWGYFEQKCFGVTLRNGLILEFLDNARNPAPGENEAAVALLAALYEKGISHPDFMRNNIMLSGPDQLPFLIDLELCSFLNPRDIRLPLMNLARYIEYNETPFNDPNNQSLIHRVYDALQAPPVSRECFLKLLAMLNKQHLTTRERVGLILPAAVLAELNQASTP